MTTIAPYNSNILKTSKVFNDRIFSPYFASFISNTTQNSVVSPSFVAITYSGKALGNMDLSGSFPSSQIIIPKDAVYRFFISCQCNSTSGNHFLDIWAVVNGVAVPDSSSRTRINGNTETLIAIEYILDLRLGDVLQLYMNGDSTNAQLLAIPASSPRPNTPSIIVSIVEMATYLV